MAMRTKKGEKWDGMAARMVGGLGGCTVEVAAEVRVAMAETSGLYGSEFWGGEGGRHVKKMDRHQAKVARCVLGARRRQEC